MYLMLIKVVEERLKGRLINQETPKRGEQKGVKFAVEEVNVEQGFIDVNEGDGHHIKEVEGAAHCSSLPSIKSTIVENTSLGVCQSVSIE